MNVGKYPLIGSMVQQLNNIDLISNNLANMNTNSYKAKYATQETFTDVLGKLSKEKIDLNLDNNTVEAAQYINRELNLIPRQGVLYLNEEVGSQIQTGNALDFSINKPNTFFVTINENGDKRLTRDGSFMNKNGLLATKEGNLVLNNNGKPIALENENWEQTLGLYDKNMNELKTLGNNQYITEEKDFKLYADPFSVVQNTLESSNINGITEMTKLIENHRLFEQMQKGLHTFQEIDRISNDKIGNYKA